VNTSPCNQLNGLAEQLRTEYRRIQSLEMQPGGLRYMLAYRKIRAIHELISQHRATCGICNLRTTNELGSP
jgi:hypothetical protein